MSALTLVCITVAITAKAGVHLFTFHFNTSSPVATAFGAESFGITSQFVL
ncbi:hypothetical protein BFJ63_vAg10925 [Fusarium oxysporum f. sp. narcissi]|uniref:Uncharacterized protein n=2 Tax=Fusarium oxysporum TaxID=5507 RepID=A0A420PV82_FUSOX|nr:hypothetical protein BFJ69_g13516 [Fusarium oxysporum]RKK96451.1 hypothetical protein BFJ68_g14378 [Fusarium oxysporum]RYC86149.1 hypothetical protein BFJ63_vAg10925 [Fusarium oxysporum f. sp. narcissi]